MVFYRYRDPNGAWVVTDRLSAVPEAFRGEVERVELPDPPQAASEAPNAEAVSEAPAAREVDWAAWLAAAREAVPSVPGPGPAASRWDWPSAGLGFGLGLSVFVVYAILRRAGPLFTRLALFALVVLVIGSSVAGMWVVPRIPGAPEWLRTPDELMREARRVTEEVAPEKRLGDLQ